MREDVLDVAERIRDEIPELERVLDRAQAGWRRYRSAGDDLYVDSVALSLHGFYGGLEQLFELTAKVIDGVLPRGAEWHDALLRQMAAEVAALRPAVLSESVRADLDGYRKLRHLVRHIYTTNIRPDKLASLVDAAPAVFAQVRAELLAFADFLEQSARNAL